MKTYTNKQSKEIEDFINEAREKLIKDHGLPPECLPYKAKVKFIKEEK